MSENTVRIYCKPAIGPVVWRHCRCADLTLYNERGGTITTALAELQKRSSARTPEHRLVSIKDVGNLAIFSGQ